MTALRIQLRRTKGWRIPENTVKCDRSTKWGNPWKAGLKGPSGRVIVSARHAAQVYHGHAPDNAELVAGARAELAGRNLACWCQLCDMHAAGKPWAERCPDCAPCHVDTLLTIANTVDRTTDDFVEGYRDGGDPDAPEPSANRSACYKHSFAVRRAEKAGTPIPAHVAREAAALAEQEDEES